MYALKFQALALQLGLLEIYMALLVGTSVPEVPLYVKGGSQWQIQVLKKRGVGLRRVRPAPKTGQKV